MTETQPEINTYFAPTAFDIASRAGVVAVHYDLQHLDRAADISQTYGGRMLPVHLAGTSILYRFAYPGAAFSPDRTRFDTPFAASSIASNYYTVDQLALDAPAQAVSLNKADMPEPESVHQVDIKDFDSNVALVRKLAISLMAPTTEDVGFKAPLKAWATAFREAVVPARSSKGKLRSTEALRNEAIGKIVSECSQAIILEKRSVPQT